MVAKKKADFTIRTTKFQVNKMLNRKQMMVEIAHPMPWCGTVPGKLIRKKLATLYKVADENQISLFNFKTQFGGGKTTGFALIYDDMASFKRIEPTYRLSRVGMGKKRKVARKSLKEKKNRMAKNRGKAKVAQAKKKK